MVDRCGVWGHGRLIPGLVLRLQAAARIIVAIENPQARNYRRPQKAGWGPRNGVVFFCLAVHCYNIYNALSGEDTHKLLLVGVAHYTFTGQVLIQYCKTSTNQEMLGHCLGCLCILFWDVFAVFSGPVVWPLRN